MRFIYLTINKCNGKCYIGSHNNLNDNYYGSGILIKKAIKKYGKQNFLRIKLKNINEHESLIYEQKYIEKFDTLEPNGYNISPTGGLGILGHHSQKTCEKIRKSNIGKTLSIEHKQKISKNNTGKSRNKNQKISEETRKKISESNKGKTTWMKGKTHSEETRKKISKSKKENPIRIVISAQGLENIRESMRNRIISKETRQKMSNSHRGLSPSNKGKHHTLETKQKMSNSKKGKYNKEKNPMFGKSPYDIWVQKYGLEEANKRKQKLYENRSINIKNKNKLNEF